MRERRLAVSGGVLPLDAQQRQAAALLDRGDQVREQARVIDSDTPTDRGAGQTSCCGGVEVASVNKKRGPGTHDSPRTEYQVAAARRFLISVSGGYAPTATLAKKLNTAAIAVS